MIQTTMTLEPKPTFACNNQLEQCFETRFANCFAADQWYQQQKTSFTVSVFRTALPWGYDNVTSAPEVTIIFQLLTRRTTTSTTTSASATSSPDTTATTALIAQADALSPDRKVRDKCNFAGLTNGFRLLTAWKEPPSPPSDLSENWLGIGMSILCAFIPVIVVSLNVYRRWRKISISNENYRKIMEDLLGKKKANRRDDDDGSTTSTDESNNNDSDFEELEQQPGGDKQKRKKERMYYEPPSSSTTAPCPEEESAVEMTEKKQEEILKELNEEQQQQNSSSSAPSAEAVIEDLRQVAEELEEENKKPVSTVQATKNRFAEI